jgi:hypothetical protein
MKKKAKEEKKEEIKEEVKEVVVEVVEVVDTELLDNLRFDQVNKFVSDFHQTLDDASTNYKVSFNSFNVIKKRLKLIKGLRK